MKLAIILFCVFTAQIANGFVEPMEWGAKCVRADAIIRGVVIDMILLTKRTDDSRGLSRERIVDKDFSGPHAVAIVRVTDVLKGPAENYPPIMFIPCGYDFDESPAELTRSKDYILFLHHMGANYFQPLDPFSMHRVQVDRVSKSGFDTESDFKDEAAKTETVPLSEFKNQIAETLRVAAAHHMEHTARGNNQKGEQDGTEQPATHPESKSEGGDKPQPEAEGRSR
jgi:hypothetical protein